MRIRIRKNQGHSRFYILLSLLLLLICVRYALQVNLPKIIYLLVILLIAAYGDRSEIVAMCMCCIPLHESVDFFYAVVICMVFYLLKYHREIRINLVFVSIVSMVLWELLHFLGQTFELIGFLTDIIPLLALLVFVSADTRKTDYAFVARVVAATTAVLCVTLLIRVLFLARFNLVAALAGIQRLGLDATTSNRSAELSGGEINPNTLGIICILATTPLMQLRTVGQGRKTDMLLSVILLVFGALTSSRTYLVCLAMMVLLLLFSQKGSINQKLRFLGIIILLIVLALLILNFAFPDLLRYYYSRFFEEDITTGRIGLMDTYHEFIVSNSNVLAFGIGLHDLAPKVMNVYRLAIVAPHNFIQELVIAWGLPGLVMFAAMLLMMILRSRQFCRRQSLLHYIPLLIILFKSLAGQLLDSYYTMLALSYAYLSLTQNFWAEEQR